MCKSDSNTLSITYAGKNIERPIEDLSALQAFHIKVCEALAAAWSRLSGNCHNKSDDTNAAAAVTVVSGVSKFYNDVGTRGKPCRKESRLTQADGCRRILRTTAERS